jgi:HD-GYP domain-containing protein (c-di-GMP phosphodiesterase class II)
MHAALTTLALFAAASILVEAVRRPRGVVLEDAVDKDAFAVAAAVQLAGVIVLGPLAGALAAVCGILAVRRFHGTSWARVGAAAVVTALSAGSAGYVFELAHGHPGHLALPRDLVALVALGLAFWTAEAVLFPIATGESAATDAIAGAGATGLAFLVALFAIHNAWNLVALVPVLLLLERAHGRLVQLRGEVARALETFANIVDERDPSTYRHSVRVAEYVHELAVALKLPPADVARLRWAGRLHDLGKVAVDAAVLRKPEQLDESDWAAVRRAPRLSARLLQRFRFAAQQAQAVEYHHERFDGSGYYGVEGTHLPLASHFLNVADSFDAMTSERAFRPGLSDEEALDEIERNIGTQFHPGIAKAFIAVRRGLDPAAVLSPEELAELREAAVPHRLPMLPDLRELRERPELVALAGVLLALVAVGLARYGLAIAGAAIACAGFGLHAATAFRAQRLSAALRQALGAPDVFDALVTVLERNAGATWTGLVAWGEHGLGGSVARERGAERPNEASLVSWLVRDAESGNKLVVAPELEFGRAGVLLAMPLRRENSALVAFLVLAGPRRLPAHVERALGTTLDEVALALAGRPLHTRSEESPSSEPEPEITRSRVQATG